MKIPADGLRGDALREAQATELGAMVELVRCELVKARGGRETYPQAIYPDRVVIIDQGRYFAYPYSIADGNVVTIGAPHEVVQDHVPVTLREAKGVFLEAQDAGRWLIRVVRAGLSGNANFYPDAVLREAVSLFDGARVFVKSDAEHIAGSGKDVRNLIGGLAAPRFVEGKSPDSGEIVALLQLIEPDGPVAVKMREAFDRRLSSLFGFSIDCEGKVKATLREGKRVRMAQSIDRVNSVDLIVEPGAGGELIRLVEAQNTDHSQEDEDMKLRERMVEAIKAKKPEFTGDGVSDEALEAAYREAIAPAPVADPAQSAANAAVLAEVRMIEARSTARELIGASTLPQPAKDRLLTRFVEATAPYGATDVTQAIDAERAYLAQFVESGRVKVPFEGMAQVEDKTAATAQMLDDFFAGKPGAHSFKEAYRTITGDQRVTGRIRDMDHGRMAEALGIHAGARFIESIATSTFSNALGDSIHRAMIAAYQGDTDKQAWRKIVKVVPRFDFRNNEAVRIGGYGNLPAVAQGAAYNALSSPSDEKATYAVSKRGGTEDMTLEAIRNDDVGLIRAIPTELALAASNTLYEFVFDFLRTNPTIYDGVALFHASHNNLGTTALDAANFAAARLAMVSQTRAGSGKRINAGPAYLLVPFELQETAWNLFVRGTNNDKTYVQTLNPEVVPVDYWTDANDWVITANPMRCPTIEVGFLDGNEDPELFVQDSPTVGSMFSNDKLTWKIRHIYGGAVNEYRGLRKHVVP